MSTAEPSPAARRKRAYSCSQCSASFKRSEHLVRHKRSHTMERPFDCSYCHNSFGRKDILQRHIRNCARSALSGKPLRTKHKPRSKKLPYPPRQKSSAASIPPPQCPPSPPLSNNGSENASKGAAEALAASAPPLHSEFAESLPSPPAISLIDEIASITIPFDSEPAASFDHAARFDRADSSCSDHLDGEDADDLDDDLAAPTHHPIVPYMSPSDLMESHRKSVSAAGGLTPSAISTTYAAHSDFELMPPPLPQSVLPPSPQLSIVLDDDTVPASASWSGFLADDQNSTTSPSLSMSSAESARHSTIFTDDLRTVFVSHLSQLCGEFFDFHLLIPQTPVLCSYLDTFNREVDSVLPIIHRSFFEFRFLAMASNLPQDEESILDSICDSVLLLTVFMTGATHSSQDNLAVQLRMANEKALARISKVFDSMHSDSSQLSVFQARFFCHLFDVWRGNFGNIRLYLDDTASKLRQNISAWNDFSCQVADFVMAQLGAEAPLSKDSHSSQASGSSQSPSPSSASDWQQWITKQTCHRLYWACSDLMSMVSLLYGQQPLFQQQQYRYHQIKDQRNASEGNNRCGLSWMNELGQPPLPDSDRLWKAETAEEWYFHMAAASMKPSTRLNLDGGSANVGLFTVSIFLHAILDYYRMMAREKASKRSYVSTDSASQQHGEVEGKILLNSLSCEEVDNLLAKLSSILVCRRSAGKAKEDEVPLRRCEALLHTCRLRQSEIRSAADIFGNIYFKDEFQIDLICTLGRNGKHVHEALYRAIEYMRTFILSFNTKGGDSSQNKSKEIRDTTELQAFWDACLYTIAWLTVIDAVSESGGAISENERTIVKEIAGLFDPDGKIAGTEVEVCRPEHYITGDDSIRDVENDGLLRKVATEVCDILDESGRKWGIARDMAVVLKRSVLCISS
ncbi:hypothetical protein BZA70DRAFT_276034 [Myxozyma melibiosi]|uniref:C2H2-type domain-containing protein n=1 Tax=Myxozyma melibiosi TaxID=54550 RepID=A0ABR1F8N7_9ASCO